MIIRRCGIKKLGIIIVCAFIVSLSTNVFAQSKVSGNAQQQLSAASQPQGQQVEAKTIFSFKTELGLTDKQEKNIRDLLAKLQEFLLEKRKELNRLSAELADMIKKKGNMKSIRAKIDSIARLRADASYMDVEISRKIESVLTQAQLLKWKKIQEDVKKGAQAK